MVGKSIGPYEVVAKLGEGGMGEVYRARDTRLGRDVALKFLPESFAADPDRRMRFEREAKTLAALNHPNIGAIYGIEDGALVMELVEGEDLSSRLARGAMHVSEAVPMARQIAEALEAAHEAGVIHRDLKPANIKVRPDGTVKILDFGLAKAITPGADSSAGPAAAPVNSPTMTSPALTAMGLILGTAAYMSPEQAKGRPVDRRADIWAFGVVLCEAVTGRRLFDAEDVSETLAAVLTRDVSATALPADVPAGLRALISDCLVRDPRRRLRDIGDARLRLEKIEAGGADAAPLQVTRASSGPPGWLWPGIAAAAIAVALLMTWRYANRPAPPLPDTIAFEIPTHGGAPLMAISPDGLRVAYATARTDKQPSRVWLRELASLESRPLPGTDGVWLQGGRISMGLAWSPDSRAVALTGPNRSLIRIDVDSGQMTELVAVPGDVLVAGGWSREAGILFGRRSTSEVKDAGIWRVAETGGSPTQVTAFRAGELWHRPVGFLPDGRRFLYVVYSGVSPDGGELRVGSIDVAPGSQDATPVLTASGPATYAPALDAAGVAGAAGYLLFVRRGALMAQAFDPVRAALISDVPVQIASGAGQIVHASNNGRLLFRPVGDDDGAQSELLRLDRAGKVVQKIGPAANYGDLSGLADSARLAVVRFDPGEEGHLHIVDLARGVFSRLTPGARYDYASAPAPDHTVAYTYSPTGVSRDIYVRAANGVGDARLLVASESLKHPNDWSPDGRFLLYDDHVIGRAQDLLIVKREGGAPIPFLATEADESPGRFSPDGKWVLYRSTESGRSEVYVRDFAPDHSPAYGSEKVQVSVAGGDKPRWSKDGREIFFLQGPTLMAASFTPGMPPRIGAPSRLFETRPMSYVPFDVMRDGTFIVNNAVENQNTGTTVLRVLLNWQALLRK
jgi:Tol biopolymer transport system component